MIHIPFKTINENLFYERAKGAYKAINPVRLKGREAKNVVSGCYFPRNFSDPSKDLLLRMASKIPETTGEDSNILLVNDMGLQWVKYLYEKYNIKKFTILCVSNGYASEKAIKNILTHDVTRLWDMGDIEVIPVYFDEVKDKMFDLVIANPPYGDHASLGNRIVKELIPISKTQVILMPYRGWKANNIFKYIEDLELMENNLFEGAYISDLAIVRSGSEIRNEDWMQDIIINKVVDSSLREFYLLNYEKNLKDPIFETCFNKSIRQSTLLDYDPLKFFITYWTPFDGVHSEENSKDIIFNIKQSPVRMSGSNTDCYLKFKSKLEVQNLIKFWYNNPVVDVLLKGIGQSISTNDTIKLFIPNIDWNVDRDYSNLSLEDLLEIMRNNSSDD